MVAEHLQQNGFTLTDHKGLGVDSDAGITAISEKTITEAALSLDRDGARAVFLSCTAFLTAHLVERLEQKLGLPVVTSNQALAWHALRLGGSKATLPDRGHLLRTP